MPPINVAVLLPRQKTRSHASQDPLTSLLLTGILLLLFFAVLAFGAVEPWSIAVVEISAAVLFGAWMVRFGLNSRSELVRDPLFLPVALFGILLAGQIAFRTTVYPYVTVTYAMLYVAYALLFFLTVQVVAPPSLTWIVWLFAGFGFGVSLFAVIQNFTSNGKLYWYRQPRFESWIFGPYVNHNHYAGLMEMLLPFALVPAFGNLVRGGHRALLGFAALMMAASIFLSGSRGGSFAFLAELVFLSAILMLRTRKSGGLLVISGFVLVVGLFLLWLGGPKLFHRYDTMQDPMRISILEDGIRMFAHRPVIGWGLGTFPVAYPTYRSFPTKLYVNAAHDDYLQLLIETGLLGFGLAVWFLVGLYSRASGRLQNWDTQWSRCVRLAALLGITGLLAHSVVDFNLQIPANAAFFSVLCGLASLRSRPRNSGNGHRPQDASVREMPSPAYR